ncbi:MAG: conjugal transfer protein TrbI [Cyanobacteriota bacterium]|nr:conjugal transfer protein TrbI [Cyanobacteriota bacterium]
MAQVKCACVNCTHQIDTAAAVVLSDKFFCSEACSSGHPNNEPCHGNGSCGCTCGD